MLQFNPYFRVNIEEALSHPYFDKIRKADKEVVSNQSIPIEFDQGNEVLNKKRLRELFLREIAIFKK